MYAGILTSLGITFLSAEISMLLSVSITTTVSPMPAALEADEISPRVGQVPSTSIKVGFWKMRPSKLIFAYLFIAHLL